MAKLGERLRTARKALDISQAELADRIGWSRQEVNSKERGRSIPPPHMLAPWCEVLGLDYESYSEQRDAEERERQAIVAEKKRHGRALAIRGRRQSKTTTPQSDNTDVNSGVKVMT